MFSARFQMLAAKLYGAKVDWTPQIIYMVRILGSFAFVLGLLAVAAALDPIRQSIIVYGFIALFILRDFHRLLFHKDIEMAFSLKSQMNLLTNLFFLLQTALLFVLLQMAKNKAIL